jgi:predicted small lipoprotein YifL
MLACALTQAGCGQTGPLYLPKKPAPGPETQSVQTAPAGRNAPAPIAEPPLPVSPPVGSPMPAIPASQ